MNKNRQQIIGRKIIHLDQTESTNKLAAEWVAKKDPIEGLVIITDFQTEGRGQFDRKWESEAGKNITLSVILQPINLALEDQFYLNIMTSVAVASFVRNTTRIPAIVKWPNDIYVKRRKLGGILIQNFLTAKKIRHTIVGVGLNVNQRIFPDNLQSATSISCERNANSDLSVLRSGLLKALDEHYYLLKTDARMLKKTYLKLLMGMNEQKIYNTEEGAIQGIIKGIDDSGRILVEHKGKVKAYDNNAIRMQI